MYKSFIAYVSFEHNYVKNGISVVEQISNKLHYITRIFFKLFHGGFSKTKDMETSTFEESTDSLKGELVLF